MTNNFDKLLIFTDIHLGLRNNERRHNHECEEFIKWAIQEAEKFGAKTSIFMGDFHHDRRAVQTSTLNYSVSIFKLLSKNFENHYQIIGNHDLFYKDKREINSVQFAQDHKNVHIINEITKIGDITLAPWLIDDEFKKITKVRTPYIFGHFEFPHFLMNAMTAMPDIGKIKVDNFELDGQEIYSGHFHKRQSQTNAYGAKITYMGNCFPHNYSDAGDDERGIMLLEFGKPPIYKKWPNAPKFRNYMLSDVLQDPAKYIDDKTNAKVQIDVDISYEEASFIKETIFKDLGAREIKLIPNKQSIDQQIYGVDIQFETVDQIILQQIEAMPDGSIDKELLTSIYNDL